jgi:uncharacterized repeat protein (TIGR01451 family)
MTLGISSTPASCIFTSDGAMTATPVGGTTPYTYSWTSGGTTSTVSGLPTGRYWVNVTDASGCTANSYNLLGYNPAGTSCYCTISGTVYDDVNGNCIQDAGEAGIPNIQIYCSGIGYTYTDMTGNYSFKVPSGSYTITETVLSFYPLSPCQSNNIPVTATASSGCVIPVNFANTISIIHDMHISTWDYSHPIPGQPYRQVALITNAGTVTEPAMLGGYNADGQVYAPTFTPSGYFSGAPYWYHSTTGFPSLTAGHSQTLYMDYFVPGSVPLGTSLLFKDTVAYVAPITNWLTDYSPWDNVDYFNTTVVSSYDPNFKEVSPAGTGPTGIIAYSDSVLEYMVHFQNTGTSPAIDIVVIDTLDDNLNWTSMMPVFESAKCQVTLGQSGTKKVAKFTFHDINLPTQSSSEVNSSGFFTYTIHTKPGLPVGTQFKNSASIYFDYNAPVKTNTTINTLGSTLPAVVSNTATEIRQSFTVYPNPASKTFNAIISSDIAGNAIMNIADVTGKVLLTKTVDLQTGTQSVATDVSRLTPGIYFVSLAGNGKVQTQKLVIMD